MQRLRIATFGITLAISSTGLWAAPGDTWHNAYKDEHRIEQPADNTSPRLESSIVDEPRATEQYAQEERYAEPREGYIEPPSQSSPRQDRRHPQTGQLIERGLFNKTGPNDFGA